LIYYSTLSDRLITSIDYIATQSFVTTSSQEIIKLETAGFTRIDDVDYTAYNEDSILDVAQTQEFQDGDLIWIAKKKNNDWDVFRYTLDSARVVRATMEAANVGVMTFVTKGVHSLKKGDIVSVSQFDDSINGVYFVNGVPALNSFTVSFESDFFVSGAAPEIPGLLFKFESVKFETFDDLYHDKKLLTMPVNTPVWVKDDGQGRWVVYKKIKNYNDLTVASTPLPDDQKLGWAITKKKSDGIFLVSAPAYKESNNTGTVFVYNESQSGIQFKLRYSLNSDSIEYHTQGDDTDFGFALDYDDREFNSSGFGVLFAGAPAVSFVKSDVVSGSVNYSTGTETASTLTNQGVVKISSIDPILIEENTERVLLSPYPTSDEKFGHSLYVKNIQSTGLNTALAERYAVQVLDMIVNPGTEDLAYDLNNDGVIDLLDAQGYLAISNGLTPSYSINPNSNYGDLLWDSKQFFVGAPGSKTKGSGSVYKYQLFTTATESILDIGFVGKITTSTITVASTGSRWGHAISGSDIGDILAISAPGYNTNTGIVCLYSGNDTTYLQTINSPFGPRGKFGEAIKVSANGNYLFVSAPESRSIDQAYGKVAVYKKQNQTYSLLQTIENPVSSVGMKFGQSIDINADENELVISAVGLNKNIPTTFDQYNNLLTGQEYVNDPDSKLLDAATTYDSGATKFFDKIVFSGSAYVYNRKNTLFRLAGELKPIDTNTGTNYGYSVAMNENSIYVGAPAYKNRTLPDPARSAFYQFYKIDTDATSWQDFRQQDNLVDIQTLQRVALIDSFNEEIVDYLDVIDPLKGRIAGLAEQDLTYKLSVDPAVYTIGTDSTVVDPNTNWLDEHVGELWWDLTTAKFIIYEQGDVIYRKNNWGKLFPGATIDVYEWVRSELLPSEWAAIADTPEGLTRNISGQPKHPDNSVLSVKQIYNSLNGSFINEYYFWVKNKVVVPNVTNRRISARQVASLIENPSQYGLKYAAIIDSDSVALANVGNMLVGDRININITTDEINNKIPRHTEWLLLQEGAANSVPNTQLEKKLIDSLLGRDKLGNLVPDPSLSYRQKYGINIRPRQSMFKDRFAALRNLLEFTNSVLKQNQVTGNYSFKNLNQQEQVPNIVDREYDLLVEDIEGLAVIDTRQFVQAELTCTVDNGKIRSVSIVNAGFGYRLPPKVTISDNLGAELKTFIDNLGRVIDVEIEQSGNGFASAPSLTVRPFTVIVLADQESRGKWAKYVHNDIQNNWLRVQTQKFNTQLYWDYIDWSSTTYNKYVDYVEVVDSTYQLDTLENILPGQYVKVKNNGLGNYIIVEKTLPSVLGNFSRDYDIVFSEKGTIKIKDLLWNLDEGNLGYDEATGLDQTLYDQTPNRELEYILVALKEDIFINELKVNWNLFFFKAVKYALGEQKLLDWAFKTSYINVTNYAGNLDQRPIYKLQNSEYYEDYLKEVKPYHTKIRNFTTNYSIVEPTGTEVTDFDLPAYYNTETNKFSVIQINASTTSSVFTLTESLTNINPWKYWTDNYTFGVGTISVSNPGAGYTVEPTVEILAADGDYGSGAKAKAYIRSGEVFEILVTDPGNGYVVPPTIYIQGGGPTVTTTAKAYANLFNGKVRSTLLGMRFDRTSRTTTLNDSTATDRFICNGSEVEYRLTWLADPDKFNFTVKLDGALVLGSNYTIVYDSEYQSSPEEYTVQFCKLVFLDLVPKSGQVLEINYLKNIDLFNAVDRVENYYQPKSGMPGKEPSQVMTGIEYPKTRIEALKFNYTTKWDLDYSVYGETAWADDVSTYLSSTATANSANIGSTQSSIQLQSVSGIKSGYFANVISTITNAFTATTVKVTAVNTATKLVTFNSNVVSTLTTGTEIEFWSYSADLTLLDSAIDGGTWNTSTRISALGINPEDIIISGDGFITPNTSHAPEELVPGEINESLGIGVFTKNPEGAPIVISSHFSIDANTTATKTLSLTPPSFANIQVNFENTILQYTTTTNFASAQEFTIDWENNQLIIAPQSKAGKVGYQIVSVGGGRNDIESGVIDSVTFTTDQGEAQLVSLGIYGTVKSAYVSVNGVSTNNFTLTAANSGSSRAAVNVSGLTTGTTSTIIAWFFGNNFKYFNEVREQTEDIVISTNNLYIPLDQPPGSIQPASANILVELTDASGTRILRPPYIDYYKVTSTLNPEFRITNYGYYFENSNVRVFINGTEIRKGFDFQVSSDGPYYKVTIYSVLTAHDAVAIVSMPKADNNPMVILDRGFDFDVQDNTLVIIPFTSIPSPATGKLKIITYTNHDDMLMRTESFNGIPNRRYKISRPALDQNYVWVVVNGQPLINRYDFDILDDMVTIQVSDRFEHDENDDVVITTISSSKLASTVLGYRLFNDIFDRTHYKRLSKENTTYLTKELLFTDTEIHVADASVLRSPDVAKNMPGVILIDGERIEFFQVNNNVLSQLRRSTLGTAPAFYCETMSKVMDQSIDQTVPYSDTINRQDQLTVSGVGTYTISTSSHVLNTGTYQQLVNDGIVFSNNVPANDQIHVYYGGNQLRKTGIYYQDLNSNYHNVVADLANIETIVSLNDLPSTEVIGECYLETATNKVWVYENSLDQTAVNGFVYKGLRYSPPEFTVNTSTRQITLNIENGVQDGVLLTITKKEFATQNIWNNQVTTATTLSLMDSTTMQAKFLQAKPAELPDKYYYGGDPALTDTTGFALTDENDQPLEGY